MFSLAQRRLAGADNSDVLAAVGMGHNQNPAGLLNYAERTPTITLATPNSDNVATGPETSSQHASENGVPLNAPAESRATQKILHAWLKEALFCVLEFESNYSTLKFTLRQSVLFPVESVAHRSSR
jgi:hypothetical protein